MRAICSLVMGFMQWTLSLSIYAEKLVFTTSLDSLFKIFDSSENLGCTFGRFSSELVSFVFLVVLINWRERRIYV